MMSLRPVRSLRLVIGSLSRVARSLTLATFGFPSFPSFPNFPGSNWLDA
jgi:hypothetical protein